MPQIILAVGSKETFAEDIHPLARRWAQDPRIITVTGAAVRDTVIEKASALFLEENLVIVLFDPASAVIGQVLGPLNVLKERAGVVIYVTDADFDVPAGLEVERVAVEKEKEKRIKGKVLAAVRADGKKMTDKAFALLKERVRDEALLDEELAKLLSFVGERALVDAKDVAGIVTEMHEEDFITLSDAIARNDRKKMMSILQTLMQQGMNILAIHGFLSRHIRLILQAKEADDLFSATSDFRSFSKQFGRLKETMDSVPLEKRNFLAYQKPFYAYNLYRTSRRFTAEALLAFLGMLAEFDPKIKKGTRHERTNFEAGLLGV
jgi:DNA polymerase III delta subunit